MITKKGMSENDIQVVVEKCLTEMSLKQKIGCLSGSRGNSALLVDIFIRMHYNWIPYPTRPVLKYGIPPVLFSDGPRGVVMGKSTCFPVSMARGASFDRNLEERIGDAIGRELRAQGGNY
jgi:beta-glucosidase